jgi:hypothetical protein
MAALGPVLDFAFRRRRDDVSESRVRRELLAGRLPGVIPGLPVAASAAPVHCWLGACAAAAAAAATLSLPWQAAAAVAAGIAGAAALAVAGARAGRRAPTYEERERRRALVAATCRALTDEAGRRGPRRAGGRSLA